MAYKRRFSDDDAELMEEDANAASRMTAAERQMALAGNSFNNRNNQIADLTAAAHERRMASRARFIEGNPNSVSPQERAGVMQWQHDQGLTGRERALQDFERGMARDRIKGDVAVAHEKRLGMREQGSDAAEANGKWGLEIESTRGQNALNLAEREWTKKKEIAEIEAKTRQLGIEAEHGSYDEQGKYRPGSRVLSERERGDSAVDVETARQEGALKVEQERSKTASEIAKENRLSAAIESNTTLKKQLTDYVKAMSQKDPGFAKLSPEEQRRRALEFLNGGGGLNQFEVMK